jgi:hypothetical protein
MKLFVSTKKLTKPINKLLKKTNKKITIFVINVNDNYFKYSEEERYIIETIANLLI